METENNSKRNDAAAENNEETAALPLKQANKYGKAYCSFTASEGEAIELALLSLEREKPDIKKCCLLPAYLCDEVFSAFRRRGWELVFYAVDRELISYGEELFRLALEHDPGLIFIHPYYGTDTCRELRVHLKALRKSGIFVMEDVSQSYYLEEAGKDADFVAGSLREWYDLADGAFVAADLPLAEDSLDCGGPRKMSSPSVSALSAIDEAAAASKRAENYAFLYEKVIKMRRLRPILPKQDGQVSLHFPIYAREREELLHFLRARDINAVVLWPVGEENRGALLGDEDYIDRNMLALPVDWRCGIDELKRIGEALSDYEKQWVVGIRADANETVATGHIMRCITIAEALRRKGFRTVFFTADETAEELLSQAGMEQVCLHTKWDRMEEELPRLREMLSLTGIGILLVDSYQATPAYFEGLKDLVKLVCLDDCFEAVYPVDLLINYNAYHTRFPYEESYDRRTKLLLGTAYVPLRREFAWGMEEAWQEEFLDASGELLQENGRQTEGDGFSVLLASGGGDAEDALMGILEKAVERAALKNVTFHVVAGVYHPRGDELEAFADAHANVCVYRPCQDMASLMQECDAAASAAGTMLYELSAMQVPAVFFQTADNQRYDGSFFAEEERMLDAGDIRQDRQACLTAVCEGLERILADGDLRARMREKLSLVTDGRGAERIAEEIAKL